MIEKGLNSSASVFVPIADVIVEIVGVFVIIADVTVKIFAMTECGTGIHPDGSSLMRP